jgi:flagellar protein FlaI
MQLKLQERSGARIARKVGRQITILNPILDAHLVTGDRVNATKYPISTAGNSLTLRLFARNPWTLISLIKEDVKSMSVEMAALLWQAIHYEMNIIVSGGTASGKTSALNSLVALIPPHQRVITIEDTRELVLPKYQWNWVPMSTRAPNPEGLGEVTMLDLVVNALRMRPDRIVMGEIRRKREAEVLFEAMHTGHSVYGTIHADTGEQVIKRLTEPPIEVPPGEVEDIHLVLVQYRDRRKNLRRSLELSEVVPGAKGPELNYLYKWRARTDAFDKVRSPHRYVEIMNLHTGMTERETSEDQQKKMKVLQWMIDNELENVNDVGRVMKNYYADEGGLIKGIEKKQKPDKILGE